MKARYHEIADLLEKEIPKMLSRGETKLPSEPDLCEIYACSRQTVRSALAVLFDKGHIVKHKGSGTYINVNSSKGKILLVLPRGSEYVFHGIKQYTTNYFSSKGIEVLCISTDNRILKERKILTESLENPPAGIIIYQSGNANLGINNNLLEALVNKNVPIVSLCKGDNMPKGIVSISADIMTGAYAMAEKLCSNGAKKIKAILPISATQSTEQMKGIFKASLKNQTEFEENDVVWLSDNEIGDILNSDYRTLQEKLRPLLSPGTALFCGNDEIAYHVTKLLSRHGFNIPDDIQVSGFDNSYYCTNVSPTISSVGCEPDAHISAACRTLLNIITGREAQNQTINMNMFARRSTK
ncbi:MAG: substrate-binding domain-containing protein [Clostridia bacterium]|nr:substrate-binding domain-containing protein [Clostridia bacterium]